MEGSRKCHKCRGRILAPDDMTGNMVCVSCGAVQEFNNFEAHIGGVTGQIGTFVRMGTLGSGSIICYKERKIFHAQKLIENEMLRLGVCGEKTHEVKLLVEKITDGEYGDGTWFPVFVGACAYVVMRKDHCMLPIVEIADSVGCDASELGHMVSRVVKFIGLKLPEFDIVDCFERAMKISPSLSRVSEDIVGKMLQQGVFLVQCLVKWFLTTGRRPLPVVVAVLIFVGELNEVDVKLEDLAKELHAAISTCRRRYKELLETLVKVAQVLPWGKDVNVKNIVKSGGFVMQYLEKKSMRKYNDEGESLEDMEELVGQCLRKDTCYGYETHITQHDSAVCHSQDIYKLTSEYLSMIYSKYLNQVSADQEKNKRRKAVNLVEFSDWWEGKSVLCKKVYLKQLLEKDVGFDPSPPSFDKGCLARENRRIKINAAKLRIQTAFNNSCSSSKTMTTKLKLEMDVDWEDVIIETLLLHGITEDKIEDGHYSLLLDLHVFNHCPTLF